MGTPASPAPLCFMCRRYQESYRCEAYPEGIPFDIIASEVDHRRPLPEDDGLQFLSVSEDASRYAAELFSEPTHDPLAPEPPIEIAVAVSA